jgi:hypothetical protein
MRNGKAMDARCDRSCLAGVEPTQSKWETISLGLLLSVWDQNGEMRTSYNAARGRIGPALVPTSVWDALNRHVAVKLAEERLAGNDGSGN